MSGHGLMSEMKCMLAVGYVVQSGMHCMGVNVGLCHQAGYVHVDLHSPYSTYTPFSPHTTPQLIPPHTHTHTHTHTCTCRICLITTTQEVAATTIVTTLPPPPHTVTPPPVIITPHMHAPRQPEVAPVPVAQGHLR